ncbi:MAG: glyoxalase [Betaproteobacteria bacterium]|nr:glyoxalase [Betaproteobacteria bacterium]
MNQQRSEIGAHLDHLCIESEAPANLAAFAREALSMDVRQIEGERWLCIGQNRPMLVTPGRKHAIGFVAFSFADAASLAAYRQRLERGGTILEANPSSLFGAGAFAVRDPEGNRIAFGVKTGLGAPDALPAARIQHVGIRTPSPEALLPFYAGQLGFVVSDRVEDEHGVLSATFLRVDAEHHALALFQAPESRLDHVSFDTPDFYGIRDWADHMGRKRVPIFWGVGRHGPGNDLFFMVKDPEENLFELSTELEHCAPDRKMGLWPKSTWTLNQWGPALMRS